MVISSVAANPFLNSPSAVPFSGTGEAEVAANNRTLSAAVRLLNDSGAAGESHAFSISIDPKTRQAIVRIVETSTNKVVDQVPSEYLLAVAQQLSEGLSKQTVDAADKNL